MRTLEGRGYLVRCASDTPFTGWISARQLESRIPLHPAPWPTLQVVSGLAALLPGGLGLIWDLSAPPEWPRDVAAAFWGMAGRVPGLTLHLRDGAAAEPVEGPLQAWFHGSQPPTGSLGHAWRCGRIGWVPEAGPEWLLPGFGRTDSVSVPSDEVLSAFQWGEIVVALGALKELAVDELAARLGDLQAGIERNFSLRLSVRAWPEVIPFQRRRTGWRLSVLGGREYISSSGTWEEAATRLDGMVAQLADKLKCPLQLGSCHDPDAASLLGHQAMREGHPWRYSLPIPPASPTFTPGLGTDPREASPLESRMLVPGPLAPLLAHPPVAYLRLPNQPQEAAVTAFLRGLDRLPAIRWLPPDVPPPGPFSQERPWAPASAFTPLPDVTQALQPRLFEDLEAESDAVPPISAD